VKQRAILGLLILAAFITTGAYAASEKPSDKNAKPSTSVDSGTFGVLVNGRRVATESFRVEQRSDYSTITSELKFGDATVQAIQTSELLMLPSGVLKRYTWKETQPSKSQIVVEPQDDQFIVAHITQSPSDPPKDSVHPLAPSTSILDDNFFSHMEVLGWKYMAMNCHPNAQGRNDCKWAPLRMPVFVPHQQESMVVQFQFLSMDKMKLNGIEGEFRSFKLQSETGDWLLWFNDQNKLVRVLILADNTEVLRD
jgi:hypothetical protein